jgi:heme/copper-type cytochrome/quinol oxidase subunit 2
VTIDGVRIALIPIVLLVVALVILGILMRYRFSFANVPIRMRPYMMIAILLLVMAELIVVFAPYAGLRIP